MWKKNQWHKFTAVILATAMLLTTLTVPAARAEEDIPSVISTDAEGQAVTDADADKDDTKADKQEPADTKPDSEEPADKPEAPVTETPAQSDETDSQLTNTPAPSDTEDSKAAETLPPSDTENAKVTETPNNKKDSKDTEITKQSDTEQPDKQEQLVLKGNVTLEDLTGKDIFWKDILVRLYDADTYDEKAKNHTYIAETLTKADGSYTFEDVKPGNYRIEFINRNKQYDDITCKWKVPANGEKKIYTVEMTRQRIGIEEENTEEGKGDNKEDNEEDDGEEDNDKDDEEQKEHFAVIKNIKLPQKDLLHVEQDETYLEVNLELVETKQEAASEDREEEQQEATESKAETDFSDMLSIEDLKHIDEDIAAATMEKQKPSAIRTMGVGDGTWTFDAYYVNEDDRYDVTKTNDFDLKYQVEFHTNSVSIEANQVEIRIKRTLLVTDSQRITFSYTPSDIAVPFGSKTGHTESGSTPFNYYVENDELVFFNYKKIEAGTNIAFQVLYRNVQVMYIKDGTPWSLEPTITVNGSDPETVHLDGRVDTGVTLTSVTKTSYNDASQRYTPGLYTEAQVKKYIGKDLPSPYKENFNAYRYVVWEVEIKGTATQPWDIDVREKLPEDAQVVGYCGTDTTAAKGTHVPGQALEPIPKDNGYVRLTNENNMREGTFDRRQSYIVQNVNGNGSYVFYVVVAYPKAQVEQDPLLENSIDVRLSPLDGLSEGEEPEVKTATAKWNYVNYTWSYNGDNYELEKTASTDKYEGWMEIYRAAKKNGETINLPALDFQMKGDVTGYGLTHRIKEENGEKYSEVMEGASYTVSVIDDVLYAFPLEDNGKYRILDGTDYYYSAVSISSHDYGYDFYEDEYTTPEKAESLEIWAMFAKGDGATTGLESNGWIKVGEVPWDPNGMTYTFSNELLAREPWRVKAVHNTTNYQTECSINVSVRLRQESEKLAELISDDTQTIEILNLAGMIAKQFNSEDERKQGIGTIVNDTKEDDIGKVEGIYNEPEIDTLTKTLYGAYIQRNNAKTQLCGLEEEAGAYKSSPTQTNDPKNSRTQVTYQIGAYDGYKVRSESMMNDLKNLGVTSPGRNNVVFYDLLPYGMHFDPSGQVRVQRIIGEKTNSDHITVTTDTEDNYNGTGRTMVAFHIKYTGGDSAAFYEDNISGHWQEHWRVTFSAYYSWKDFSVVQAGVNACAFMSEENPNRRLLGKATQVAQDDGNVVPEYLEDDCKDFGIDIDKDGDYTESVLYASTTTVTNAAVATKTAIQKLVRADYDVSGEYQKSAVVAPGEGYTYDITVSTDTETSVKNLVVFDILENDKDSAWKGTFDSVVTYGLELMGIKPVIYYYPESDAPIPIDGDIPNSTWFNDKHWVEASKWDKTQEVKAVAVDLSQTIDYDSFILSGESVTFQIKMKAPAEGVGNDTYTYNAVSYYSVPVGSSDVGTIASSNSTSVKLHGMDTLEVVKEFGVGVPSEMEKTSFVFNLTQKEKVKDEDETIKFAYKEYQLYKKTEGGDWVPQEDGKIYATDAEGRLFLQAGEMAVFQLADADRINVEEQENPYWHVDKTDKTKDEDADIKHRTVTFTNTYQTVLYVKKVVSGKSVPQGEDISGKTFTFRVYADRKPLANSEFWYFKDIRTDGGIPNRVEASDGSGYKTGTTDGNGEFTISANDIVGLFPGKVGTQYKVVEILKTGDEAEWICEDTTAEGATVEKNVINGGTEEENIVEGTMVLNGSSVTFTNLYAKKELLITKKVTHQDDEDCEQPFTFQILDVTTDINGVPVNGKPWVLLDDSGKDTNIGGILGKDALGNEGTFTYDKMAGKTVKISGLQAEHTYVIKEINIDRLYVPEQDTQEVTMPVYASGESVTFVNDYRKRSLTVSKRVVYPQYRGLNQDWYDENYDYTMTAKITKAGSQESQTLSEDISYILTKKNGDKESATLENDGTFKIKNGESVLLKYVGELGDTITVSETWDNQFPQIYPIKNGPTDDDGDYEEVLGDEDSKIVFINGQKGSFVLMNNLVAGNVGGESLITAFKDNIVSYQYAPDYMFTLEMEGKSANTPGWNGISTSGTIGPYDVVSINSSWTNGIGRSWSSSTLQAKPGDIIFPKASAPSDAEFLSYSINMNEECQKFVWCWENATGGPKWYEFSMIEPENTDKIAASIEELPVAIFTNQVKEITFNGSRIEKRMVLGSSTVPDGAQLVWKLERYNGSSWVPAERVSYVLLDQEGKPDNSGIQVTGQNGKITLIKEPDTFPVVQFTEEKVYLNRYDNAPTGTLRLVELMEESDKAWGRLAGYGDRDEDEDDNFSLFMSSNDAVAFVNSNRTTPVKIAKHMESSSDEIFTMYLRQVLSATKNPADINSAGDIKESVAGAGIGYIVYDSRTNKELRRGTTGGKGEILIKAGEYARLDLPDKTLWTVSEGVKAKYELESLTGTAGDGIVKPLGENLMLIYPKAEVVPAMIKAKHKTGYILTGGSISKEDFTVTLYDSDGKELPIDGSKVEIDYTLNSGFIGTLPVNVSYEGLTTRVMVEVAEDTVIIQYASDLKNYFGIDFDGTTSNLVIPSVVSDSRYGGRRRVVVEIGDSAFNRYDSLKEVSIPGSVTNIGYQAFRDCTSLESVTIHYGVESIGAYAFDQCQKLENIILPESVKTIGRCAFYNCYALKEITIPDNVTTIADNTFYNCSALESIDLPDSITTVEERAFQGCEKLKRIELPNLIDLGQYTFINCISLYSVKLPDVIPKEIYPDNPNSRIGKGAFQNCKALVDITIPSGITIIKEDTFNGCTSLPDTINIPDSVTTIGINAFSGCEAFTNFTMPKGVISVKNGAFVGCKNLESVVITSNVKTLGNAVFGNCSNLKNITIENGVTEFGVALFRNCTSLESITIPESVTTIKLYYNDSGKEEDKELPFNGCTSLKEIYIDQYESASQLKSSDWELPDTVKVIWREP